MVEEDGSDSILSNPVALKPCRRVRARRGSACIYGPIRTGMERSG